MINIFINTENSSILDEIIFGIYNNITLDTIGLLQPDDFIPKLISYYDKIIQKGNSKNLNIKACHNLMGNLTFFSEDICQNFIDYNISEYFNNVMISKDNGINK